MNDSPDLSELCASLNAAQRDAVTAPPEHRLVLAGAGSGKTRVLVHRIAWLIEVERVSPLSILAVTFTNKAAHEMRARIEQLVSVPMRAMWVGTFHGIAHRMLRLHWKEAGLQQAFQILDADDQRRLVKRVIKALDLPDDQWPEKVVTAWINGQKEEGRRPADFADDGDFSQRQFVRIYTAYEQSCADQGLVDFAELLLRAYELCRDVPEIQQHYRQRFRHLLVDEFQDTNRLQYLWLRTLAGTRGVMFAVGDDDQSIYGWRGARIDNLLNFSHDFPGTELIRLEQNYRSTATVLKAANGLIEKNSGRLGKNLWTDGRDGEPIDLYAAFNEYDEAEYVCARIREQLEGRLHHRDIAILYRSNAQSRVLEEVLIRSRLPYRIYGGLRFFERQEIKDALAWLRLMANPDDSVSFERALGAPPQGVGAASVDKLRAMATASGGSLWAAARHAGPMLGRTAKALDAFVDRVEALRLTTLHKPLGEVMEVVIERSGLREFYRHAAADRRGGNREQAEGRLENLDELISAARAYERGEDEDVDLVNGFLAHAALEAGDAQATAGEDCVQLMTLHAAKGLEFPVVFIVGLEQGLFPSLRAVDEGNLEEERRLAYVGITRARSKLYLSHAETRRVHGVEQISTPSTFIREIPSECIVEARPRAGFRRPLHAPSTGAGMRSSSALAGALRMPGNALGLKLGQRVRHPKFGEGVIVNFEGEGERARVEVRFAQGGSKWLMAVLAKLEVLDG